MKAYMDLVTKFNELEGEKNSKIQSLHAELESRQMLLKEKMAAYAALADDDEKDEIIRMITSLKTEIQLLEGQIKRESGRDLREEPHIKALVQEVGKEYKTEFEKLQEDMGADVASLGNIIPQLRALHEKYISCIDINTSLKSEVEKTGRYYMDDAGVLLNYQKDKYTSPDYNNPNGYLRLPDVGRPRGIYEFARELVDALNQFGLEYIAK